MTATKKLVGTRAPGSNPAMCMGWPGVLRVLTMDERRQSERDWDARFLRGKEKTDA